MEPPEPGPDRCVEVLDDIVRTWRADRMGAQIPREEHEAFGPALFALVSQVVTLADSLANGWKQSEGHPSRQVAAMALVRQIIEFSIRAVWLELYRDKTESVLKEGARQHLNMLQSAVKVGWLTADATAVREAKEVHEHFQGTVDEQKLERICAGMSLEGWSDKFYLYFRIASNLMHPSSLQTDMHMMEEPDSPQKVGFVTVPETRFAPVMLGVATQFVVLACLAWDRADNVRYQHYQLKRYASEFGVPVDAPTKVVPVKAKKSRRRGGR